MLFQGTWLSKVETWKRETQQFPQHIAEREVSLVTGWNQQNQTRCGRPPASTRWVRGDKRVRTEDTKTDWMYRLSTDGACGRWQSRSAVMRDELSVPQSGGSMLCSHPRGESDWLRWIIITRTLLPVKDSGQTEQETPGAADPHAGAEAAPCDSPEEMTIRQQPSSGGNEPVSPCRPPPDTNRVEAARVRVENKTSLFVFGASNLKNRCYTSGCDWAQSQSAASLSHWLLLWQLSTGSSQYSDGDAQNHPASWTRRASPSLSLSLSHTHAARKET